jgi:hypothetical protein
MLLFRIALYRRKGFTTWLSAAAHLRSYGASSIEEYKELMIGNRNICFILHPTANLPPRKAAEKHLRGLII